MSKKEKYATAICVYELYNILNKPSLTLILQLVVYISRSTEFETIKLNLYKFKHVPDNRQKTTFKQSLAKNVRP